MAKLNTEGAQPKTASDLRGHNIRMQLLSYVERYERLQEERDSLGDDQKEVMEEAKSLGFDTSIIKKVIQRRKKDAGDLSEQDALLELYEDTITQAMKQQVKQSEAEATPPAQMDVEEVVPADNIPSFLRRSKA